MESKVKNMTSGSPGKLIMAFAVPLMLGNIFQQLYTMVDTMVVGQIVGVEALAALGAADWLVWLVLGLASGMTQGFSILVSQYYGADNLEKLRKAVALSYVLTGILAVVVLAVSQLVVHRVMLFLNTPADIIDMSMLYLRIVFCGIPVIAAYNILAAVLRAMGNSRSPLTAMIVAALINVCLDLLFVAVLGWGIAGAAAATVIAQGFSAVYCFGVLRKLDILSLTKKDFRPDARLSGRLLQLGAPIAVQNMIISIGGLVVQYVVNGFGFLFVAGFTATNKLYGLLELAAISYGYAITTYVGQNLGAGEIRRIKKGITSGTVMAVITSLAVGIIMVIAGRGILSLFVSGEPEQVTQVLNIAYKYLFIMSVCLWVLYLLYVYRSAIQGLGNTVIPLISGIVEFMMRIGAALLLPRWIGQNGIFYAEISAWTGAAVLLGVSYFWMMRRTAN
ncbi:MAG: MATE family efflux transporter [Oliverpabstia sp.]